MLENKKVLSDRLGVSLKTGMHHTASRKLPAGQSRGVSRMFEIESKKEGISVQPVAQPWGVVFAAVQFVD